jgi:Cu(I)/Ag(I) efflux system membrane fusion protein
MKNSNKTSIVIAVATLIMGLFLGWLIFGKSESKEVTNSANTEQTISDWTCSMHPQIRTKEAGDCPICGMELIPVGSSDADESNPMEVKMSPTAMQLANVQTALVKLATPVKKIKLNGKVQINESTVSSQTSHISGRIEQLLINTTGEHISKGQIVAYVYSPELINAQKELFEAEKIKDSNPKLFEAVKEKLKNWKLTDQQIEAILSSGKPSENFPILADVNGVVISKKVNLGDHIKSGESLFEIADLSKVWILFDVYESDLEWVKTGDEIEYTVQSLPSAKFKGKVTFVDPVINPKTRVAKARIVVANKANFKPEMFVEGTLSSPISKANKSIIVPKTAVMWTGEKSVVYVISSESNGINFMMRKVTLGTSLGDDYVITDGLIEGEEIATNGTFSIDAAAQLAGKPSMMNPDGGKAMTGHNHGGNSDDDNSTSLSKPVAISIDVKESIQPLFKSYLNMKNALVVDELSEAISQGKEFQKQLKQINMAIFKGDAHNVWMLHSSKIEKSIRALVTSKDLTNVRKHFVALSEQMVFLIKTFQPSDRTIYIQHCPMANEDNGADWLSTEKEIKNPYFGASMMKCGEVKDIIK